MRAILAMNRARNRGRRGLSAPIGSARIETDARDLTKKSHLKPQKPHA
jgi:hypothetical protein